MFGEVWRRARSSLEFDPQPDHLSTLYLATGALTTDSKSDAIFYPENSYFTPVNLL